MAGAVAAGVLGLGGASPAYAVTRNPDGTLTVAISRPSGVAGASATLHAMGSRVVVVPVGQDCPAMNSLPAADSPLPAVRRAAASRRGGDGSVTVDVHAIPPGALALVAADATPGGGMTIAVEMIKGSAPSCVSLPPQPAGAGQGRAPGGAPAGVRPVGSRTGTSQAGTSSAP